MTEAVAGITANIAGAGEMSSAAKDRDGELRKSAKSFEAVFVAQMLSQSGLGKALGADGGFGGEAFSGFLVEQYANRLVEQGGFGLAEKIYQQLRQQDASHAERPLP